MLKIRKNDARTIRKTHTHTHQMHTKHSKFMRKQIKKYTKLAHKPYAKHTQVTHDKCRNARNKFMKTHWVHTNTIRKPCAKHTRKTYTRNAETHTTGSQKGYANTTKKHTSTHQVQKNIENVQKMIRKPYTHHTHNTHKTNVEQHTIISLKR